MYVGVAMVVGDYQKTSELERRQIFSESNHDSLKLKFCPNRTKFGWLFLQYGFMVIELCDFSQKRIN